MTVAPTDEVQPDSKTNSSHIQTLKQSAIEAALKRDWQRAIALNKEILEVTEKDIDSLNRLGFAFINVYKLTEAKKAFSQVKSLDPYNQIANKNLDKLNALKNSDDLPDGAGLTTSPMVFLEDPGKTKLVLCVNVAPSQTLSVLFSGQEVFMKPKNHSVEIRDGKGRYLGALPDDLSYRMIKFISGENTYSVIVKNVYKNTLTVLIREKTRGPKFANQPSFLSTNLYQSYTRTTPGDIDKPDVTPTGEEEEKEEKDAAD
jgi:hypothetical protein